MSVDPTTPPCGGPSPKCPDARRFVIAAHPTSRYRKRGAMAISAPSQLAACTTTVERSAATHSRDAQFERSCVVRRTKATFRKPSILTAIARPRRGDHRANTRESGSAHSRWTKLLTSSWVAPQPRRSRAHDRRARTCDRVQQPIPHVRLTISVLPHANVRIIACGATIIRHAMRNVPTPSHRVACAPRCDH